MNILNSASNKNTLVIANCAFNSTGVIPLHAATNGAGSVPKCTPRKFAGAAGYTPSGSKRALILGFRIGYATAAANPTGIFGYADTDAGYQTNTTPTNPVDFFLGNASTSFLPSGFRAAGPISPQDEYAFIDDANTGLIVPNGKYLYVTANNSASGQVDYQIWVREIV